MVRPSIAAATTIFEDMSDQCIYDALKKRGKNPGPVTATTRELYIKMLASMPDYSGESSSSSGTTTRRSYSSAKEVPVFNSNDGYGLYEGGHPQQSDPYGYEDIRTSSSAQREQQPKPINFDEHTAAGGWDDEVNYDDDDTPPIINQGPQLDSNVRRDDRGGGMIHQEPRQQRKGIWRSSLPTIAAVVIVGVIVGWILLSVAPKKTSDPEEPADELDQLLNSMKVAGL